MQNSFQLFSHIWLTLNMSDNIFFQIFIFYRIVKKWRTDFLKNKTVEYAKTNKTVDWKTNWKKNVAVEKQKIAEKKRKSIILKKKKKLINLKWNICIRLIKKLWKKKIETVEIEIFVVVSSFRLRASNVYATSVLLDWWW